MIHYHKAVDPSRGATGPMEDRPIVTMVRVDPDSFHDRVTVWSRGLNIGTLITPKGDGDRLADKLLPPRERLPR